MHNITGYLIKDRSSVFDKLKVWIIFMILIFAVLVSSMYTMSAIAAPVITNEYWMDTFNDTTGIESWDNLELNASNVQLIKGVTFYENFTGNNGDPPNPLVWDVIDDGYTLEIENNQLKSYISVSTGTWYNELVQTNRSFPANQVITWKQQLHLESGGNGMYYHFFILNASDDSRIFGVNQNHLNEYHAVNFPEVKDTVIGSSLSGWYDFKIIFTDGHLDYYINNVKEYEDDYDVEFVKYQFGTSSLVEASSILTDDITINSTLPFGNLTSTAIELPPGTSWDMLNINKSQSQGNEMKVSILDGITFQPIAGFENLTTSDIDISLIDRIAYPSIRLRAHFLSDSGNTSLLHDWKVSYSDVTPPATPSGFAVDNPFTGFSLIISWDPNTEEDLSNYVLYYSTDNATFNRLTNLSADTLYYIHYGRSLNQTYYYKVAAADEVPNESPATMVLEGTVDLDYDGDGVGNVLDSDDDNDGIPDIIDPYPYNPLNDMETTIDDIQSIVENLNISELIDAIDYLNQTLLQQVDQLNALFDNITGLNTTIIMEYLKGMNASLYSEIQSSLTSITGDIIDLNNSLSNQMTDILSDLQNDHTSLTEWLDIVLSQLDTNLTKANSTLHNQLGALDILITDFQNDIDSDIAAISQNLQAHDNSTGQDHSDIIDILNGLTDDVGNMDLDELKSILLQLAQNISSHDQAMADDILGVVSDIESFEASSQQKLDDINRTLDELAKLQNILTELAALQTSLSEAEQQLQESIDEIPKEKEEPEFGLVEMLLIIILVMLIINILVSILGNRKKGSSEPPTPPTKGYINEQYPQTQSHEPLEHTHTHLDVENAKSNNEMENLPQVPPPPPE